MVLRSIREMMTKLMLLGGFLVFLGLSGCLAPAGDENDIARYTAQVQKVIDGDTLLLANGEKVRLLGINAPEVGERCGEEATAWLTSQLEGRRITVETGNENRDTYGRQLRYVWVGEEFINGGLVERGLATAFVVGEGDRFTQILGQLQEMAIENDACLWKKSPNQYVKDNCIEVVQFQYDGPADDSLNPNGEWVQLKNHCNDDIDLTSWTIKDAATHQFEFPATILLAGESVTIHSGKGINYGSFIFMQFNTPIWNNGGDTLFLRNEKGELVLYEPYKR